MYIRKTEDVFYLETDYGYGKELEVSYDTFKEAKQGKKEYLDNCRNLQSIRIVRKRERKQCYRFKGTFKRLN